MSIKYTFYDFVLDCFPEDPIYAYFLLGKVNKQAKLYNLVRVSTYSFVIFMFVSEYDINHYLVGIIDSKAKNTYLYLTRYISYGLPSSSDRPESAILFNHGKHILDKVSTLQKGLCK